MDKTNVREIYGDEADKGKTDGEETDTGRLDNGEEGKKEMTGEDMSGGMMNQKNGQEIVYWLCQIPFLGPVTMNRMMERTGDIFSLYYNIEEIDWTEGRVLNAGQVEYLIREKRKFKEMAEEYHSLADRGIRFITILDKEYPKRLRVLQNGPWGLYMKGRLPREDVPSLAIVGSRNATRYGLELARCFGRELAAEGVQIISGLASGIDGAGHQGALDGNGSTFGVLGCGINLCYPRENYLLYERMAESGGILSEYPLGTKPLAQNFPVRNRIISGLADGVLVVEARERSGSLITAGLALDQGKDVFAIPGRLTDPGSFGCNHLIQHGAPLVQSPQDILEVFGIRYEKKLRIHEKNEKGLAKKEKMVYSVLDLQSKNIEDIVKEAGVPLSEGMMILLDLELKGFAVHEGGNYYSRTL